MPAPEREEAIAALAQMLDIAPEEIHKALKMLKAKTAYHIWYTPKKSGGERQMQKALWPLNKIQAGIARAVYPFSISEISHSFIHGRSCRTAILPHLHANAFFTFDIKSAFPSTRKQQVRLSLQKVGFKRELAALMADLVCYSPNDEAAFIPLGYSSSPTLFNLLLRDIDRLLLEFAENRGYAVTRYADDFAVSTTASSIPESERKLALKIVENLSANQFKVPPEKTDYREAKERVYFEFLGLAIEEVNGKRKIGVVDEKLGEYLFEMLGALEDRDFSEKTANHLQGAMSYLKGKYKAELLPLRLSELYEQYKFMREMAGVTKQGQLLLPMPPFQT